MSGVMRRWEESGRGGAPHQQAIIVTPEALTRAAFQRYTDHITECRECGEDRCLTGKSLAADYLALDRAERMAPRAEA
ncbi:hypothetical protein [Streptomyces sp. NPDC006997]|uniref:hypothetical protein n=1 Tax=Streptomyces sp. NPDC006997 TaxID=3155356 RepID=UPI0033C575B9